MPSKNYNSDLLMFASIFPDFRICTKQMITLHLSIDNRAIYSEFWSEQMRNCLQKLHVGLEQHRKSHVSRFLRISECRRGSSITITHGEGKSMNVVLIGWHLAARHQVANPTYLSNCIRWCLPGYLHNSHRESKTTT